MTILPNSGELSDSLEVAVFLMAIFAISALATVFGQSIAKLWPRNRRKTNSEQERSEKILDSAKEEALAIIKSAHEQARKIVAETTSLSSQMNSVTHEAIKNSVKEKSTQLEKSLDKLQEQFSSSLSGIQSEYINRYNKAIKAIEEDAGKQVEKMREFFESETSSSSESLQSLTKEGLKVVQTNLEGYERDQKARIDTIIYEVLKDAAEEIFGKSLTLENQQDLIAEALEEAKKKNAFS